MHVHSAPEPVFAMRPEAVSPAQLPLPFQPQSHPQSLLCALLSSPAFFRRASAVFGCAEEHC